MKYKVFFKLIALSLLVGCSGNRASSLPSVLDTEELPLLPGGVKVEGEEVVPTSNVITLTHTTLGTSKMTYAKSDFTGETAKEVAGIKFGIKAISDTTAGLNSLQMRAQDISSIWNETTSVKPIKSIRVNYHTGKTNPGSLYLFTKNAPMYGGQVGNEIVMGSGAATENHYHTVNFGENDNVRYFRIQHPGSAYPYTVYAESIVLEFYS